MDEKELNFLKEIGFTQTESKVYLTLLKLGESFAGAIASRSSLYRKNVYDSLETLSKKGLVTHTIKKGKKYWRCVNPKKIKEILQGKVLIFENILPRFSKSFEEKELKPVVEIYEGLEGIKSILSLILEEGKTLYCLGATGLLFTKLEYHIPNILFEGMKKKIKGFFLINHHIRGTKEEKSFADAKKIFLKRFQYKFLPESFKTETQIYLFGDYSVIYTWSGEPISVLIKHKELTRGFKSYFDFLWDLSS